MPGLRWPVSGNHPVKQEFDGAFDGEDAGFISFDAGNLPIRVRRKKGFPGSEFRDHVHGGVDISCGIGTVIKAPERGRVVKADSYLVRFNNEEKQEHYLMLQIKPGTVLFFTHLSDNNVVPVGTDVARGDPIALSGNSGMSTGPHLHYEVRVTSRKNPKAAKSGRWYKLDPQRLRVGGDLANLGVIKPPIMAGVVVKPPVVDDDDPLPDEGPAGPQPVDGSLPTEIELESGDDLEEDTDPDDEVGDAAFANEVEAGAIAVTGLPTHGPLGHL